MDDPVQITVHCSLLNNSPSTANVSESHAKISQLCNFTNFATSLRNFLFRESKPVRLLGAVIS